MEEVDCESSHLYMNGSLTSCGAAARSSTAQCSFCKAGCVGNDDGGDSRRTTNHDSEPRTSVRAQCTVRALHSQGAIRRACHSRAAAAVLRPNLEEERIIGKSSVNDIVSFASSDRFCLVEKHIEQKICAVSLSAGFENVTIESVSLNW